MGIVCAAALAGWAIPGCLELEPQKPRRQSNSWWGQNDPTPQQAPARRETPKRNPLLDLFRGADTSGGAKDGVYTVLLIACRAPGSHVTQAKYYKEATERHAGWKHLFILHKEAHSLLYWGKYKTVEDAQPNLNKAKDYVTPADVKLYAKAIIVPLPGKEDLGPPEWLLDNVPQGYVYTVLVAEFYDVPEADYVGRRHFAVDYCRQLRGQGHAAFYRHDPAGSIVTIGAFGAKAVVFVRKPGKRDPRLVQQEINDLFRNFPKLKNPTNRELRDKMIQDIRRKPNVERRAKDPRIYGLLRRFPCLAVNGRQKLMRVVNTKTGKVQRVPAPTSLIRIPNRNAPPTAAPAPRPASRPGDPKPGQAPGDPAGAGPPARPGAGAGGARRD
jgi:hypothetical protein